MAISIVTLNYYASTKSVAEVVELVMRQVSDQTFYKTINHMNPAEKLTKLNTVLASNGRVTKSFTSDFYRLASNELHLHPQLTSVYFGDEHGNVNITSRKEDGTIGSLELGQDYDPRQRPWYKAAKSKKTGGWTEPYMFSTRKALGITAFVPVFTDSGELFGVFATDILLKELSEFLKQLEVGKSGRAFIITNTGQTVALPYSTNYKQNNIQDTSQLKNISEISDTAIVDSFNTIKARLEVKAKEPLPLTEKELLRFPSEGEHYYGFYQPFPEEYGLNWIIGVVVPESDFMAQAKKNIFLSLMLSAISVILVLILGIYFSSKITSPLTELSEEADRIREFNLENRITIDTHFKEINRLAKSFINMKKGLKSFRKFVPADIVKYLIHNAQEAELGGEEKTLTIFFSDIVSFTSISENMSPDALVNHLGEYLEESTAIIKDEKGTIDKFVGDSVMAFWNAPNEVPNHPIHACRAAILLQKRLITLRDEWGKKSLPQFACRIGINTGKADVGIMGSQARLSYTAIGDCVNLASRIEGICKLYGVEIIIGQSTCEQAKEHITTRKLDFVKVKGKAKSVYIYELLGLKGNVEESLIEFATAYELALQCYLDHQFKKAIELFQSAVLIKGTDDNASALLVRRCEDYLKNPPPDEWDGSSRVR